MNNSKTLLLVLGIALALSGALVALLLIPSSPTLVDEIPDPPPDPEPLEDELPVPDLDIVEDPDNPDVVAIREDIEELRNSRWRSREQLETIRFAINTANDGRGITREQRDVFENNLMYVYIGNVKETAERLIAQESELGKLQPVYEEIKRLHNQDKWQPYVRESYRTCNNLYRYNREIRSMQNWLRSSADKPDKAYRDYIARINGFPRQNDLSSGAAMIRSLRNRGLTALNNDWVQTKIAWAQGPVVDYSLQEKHDPERYEQFKKEIEAARNNGLINKDRKLRAALERAEKLLDGQRTADIFVSNEAFPPDSILCDQQVKDYPLYYQRCLELAADTTGVSAPAPTTSGKSN